MKKITLFTLIELLIVIAIIGLMAALIIPRLGNLSDDAETNVGVYNARALASQIELFHAANGKYPAKFHTGMKKRGKGYGYFDAAYYNDRNPLLNSSISGQQVTGENASEICPELSENIKLNLSRAVQITVDGPVDQSLALAGISRVIFGDLDVKAVDDHVGLGDNPQWNPDSLNNACEYLVAGGYPNFQPASGMVAFLSVNSWVDADGNEARIGGRTLAQYVNQKFDGFNYAHRIAVFIVGPQVDWAAIYDTQGKQIGNSKVGIMSTPSNTRPNNYCVAFFALDMGDRAHGIEPKPAIFLGCLNASGKPL